MRLVVEIEATARLSSVLNVVENEIRALHALRDERLSAVLETMTKLRAEIVSALVALRTDEPNGR
jgi:hypothetical protein